MSETLEERFRRSAKEENKYYVEETIEVYASDIIELLDARDKTIAEQRAVIAELSEEPITEFETLRQAHDAQNAVLARMQFRIRTYRRIIKGLCGRLYNFRKSLDNDELDAMRSENAALREKTNVGH